MKKSKFKIKDYDKARKIAKYCEMTMSIALLTAGLLSVTNVLLFEELIIYSIALVISAIAIVAGIIKTYIKKVTGDLDFDDIYHNIGTILIFIVVMAKAIGWS